MMQLILLQPNMDVLTQRTSTDSKQTELFFSLREQSSEAELRVLAEILLPSRVSSLREFLSALWLRNPVLTNEPRQRVKDQDRAEHDSQEAP